MTKVVKAVVATAKAVKAAVTAESSDDSSDDSSAEEVRSSVPSFPHQLTLLSQAPKGKPAAAAAAAESSDSDDSSDEEVAEAAPVSKKRAAEDTVAPSKKAKTDDAPAAVAPVDESTAEVTTVYVGGLSWNVDNEWLKSELEVCGEVVSARVVTDRETQKSRGFGYVVRFFRFRCGEGMRADSLGALRRSSSRPSPPRRPSPWPATRSTDARSRSTFPSPALPARTRSETSPRRFVLSSFLPPHQLTYGDSAGLQRHPLWPSHHDPLRRQPPLLRHRGRRLVRLRRLWRRLLRPSPHRPRIRPSQGLRLRRVLFPRGRRGRRRQGWTSGDWRWSLDRGPYRSFGLLAAPRRAK